LNLIKYNLSFGTLSSGFPEKINITCGAFRRKEYTILSTTLGAESVCQFSRQRALEVMEMSA